MLARRQLDVAGRRMTYLDVGSGNALVLIHAFPLNAEMWQPQLDAAFDGWRAIAPDLRGFGGCTTALPESLDDYADDVVALLKNIGISQAVCAGLSMGGYVAFALFRRAPEVISGLVLADTRATPDTEGGREGRRKMQALAEREGSEGIAREMLPKLLSESTRQKQPDVVREVERLIRSSAPHAIRAALGCMMLRPDSTPDLARVRCPVLVLAGADDRLTPVEDSRKIQAPIAGAELAVIPGAGHLSNLEQPAAFNARLAAFLQQHF